MKKFSSQSLFTLLATMLFLAALISFCLRTNALSYAKERASLALWPSADRAYQVGITYLNSPDPATHNVDYAEYFLNKAIALNPHLSLAHQQLARIHFLRGDFPGALIQINEAIQQQGSKYPSAFYIRGLIEGYQGAYDSAAADFEQFLQLKPASWPGSNDYAWVLMKAHRYDEAAGILGAALKKFPGNAWLLNSYAVALYESGHKTAAAAIAVQAKAAVTTLTPQDWSRANPGNDPLIAEDGLTTFRTATVANLDIIIAGTNGALQ
jgi:tetratricopeptide (TPR) repeat protein